MPITGIIKLMLSTGLAKIVSARNIPATIVNLESVRFLDLKSAAKKKTNHICQTVSGINPVEVLKIKGIVVMMHPNKAETTGLSLAVNSQ